MSVLKLLLQQIDIMGTALDCVRSFLVGIVTLKVVIEEMVNSVITNQTSQNNLTDNLK